MKFQVILIESVAARTQTNRRKSNAKRGESKTQEDDMT